MFKRLELLAYVLVFAAVSTATVFAAPKKAAGGTTKIELWYGAAITEAGPPPTDWAAYKIIKDKLGIDLKLTALPSNESDQDVKINAAGAANSLPDLFMVRDTTLQNLVKQNLLAPVDDMFKMMPHRTQIIYDKAAQDYGKVNGKIYALAQPGSVIKNEGILIRKDWLDKLGLKVPKTLDEYMEVMKAFTFKDPDGNGKDDTYGYGAFLEVNTVEEGLGRRFNPWFGAFGVPGTWDMRAKSAGLMVHKPEFYDAMAFVKKMVDEKVIDPNWRAYKKDDFRASWKQGKFGIMREQNAAFAAESNYAPFDANFPKGSWIVADPPVGPKGLSSVGNYDASYRMYCVSAKAAKAGKKAKIAELLEWMSSDEGYFLLGWGVEGVNYVKDANGIPTVTGLADASKGYSKPESQPLTQLRNLVYYNGDIELASRYPTYKTATSGKTMSALKVLREMQSKPFMATIGAGKLPKPDADLERFYQQGLQEFLSGKRNLTKETWNAWVKEFDAQGGKKWEQDGIAAGKAAGYIK